MLESFFINPGYFSNLAFFSNGRLVARLIVWVYKVLQALILLLRSTNSYFDSFKNSNPLSVTHILFEAIDIDIFIGLIILT